MSFSYQQTNKINKAFYFSSRQRCLSNLFELNKYEARLLKCSYLSKIMLKIGWRLFIFTIEFILVVKCSDHPLQSTSKSSALFSKIGNLSHCQCSFKAGMEKTSLKRKPKAFINDVIFFSNRQSDIRVTLFRQ
jgi:hypothetical protein